MAVIQYLDKQGLTTLVKEIKKRTAGIYTIKGSAIYADADYVTHAQAGDAGYIADIDSVGLWVNNSGTWEKVTAVKAGWVYNVTNQFITDEDFIEGDGSEVVAGTNIVAINLGDDDTPNMKWDLLAMSLSLEAYQTKELLNPITVFSNQTPTVYTASADLPSTEAGAAVTITDLMVAIIGGDSTETGDVYRASVTVNASDATQNDITWVKLGDQHTVEGALAFLSNTCPNTPITDAEIIALFND